MAPVPPEHLLAAVPPAHLVGFGGVAGALARLWVSERLDDGALPTGTLAVNVLGSFLLGLVAFSGIGGDVALFVGTGVCGSFTTFSSFSYETVGLWERGERRLAAGYAFGTYVLAVGGVGVAWVLVA